MLKEGTYHARDDQRWLEDVLEAENGQAKVGEHARLGYECQSAENLLNGDSRHRWQVEMSVVGHDDAGEQNSHYAWQVHGFGEHVRWVHEYEHEGCF